MAVLLMNALPSETAFDHAGTIGKTRKPGIQAGFPKVPPVGLNAI